MSVSTFTFSTKQTTDEHTEAECEAAELLSSPMRFEPSPTKKRGRLLEMYPPKHDPLISDLGEAMLMVEGNPDSEIYMRVPMGVKTRLVKPCIATTPRTVYTFTAKAVIGHIGAIPPEQQDSVPELVGIVEDNDFEHNGGLAFTFGQGVLREKRTLTDFRPGFHLVGLRHPLEFMIVFNFPEINKGFYYGFHDGQILLNKVMAPAGVFVPLHERDLIEWDSSTSRRGFVYSMRSA